ncbi:hypothetical protein HanIR_Chr08g0355451 [Helianthus annuus]|nr:hypothetical protein HanIR_Chr08g0355451 [Helianthus annuus]
MAPHYTRAKKTIFLFGIKPDFLLAPFTGVTKRTTRPCEPREIERLRERRCIYRERHREIEWHRVEVRGDV